MTAEHMGDLSMPQSTSNEIEIGCLGLPIRGYVKCDLCFIFKFKVRATKHTILNVDKTELLHIRTEAR